MSSSSSTASGSRSNHSGGRITWQVEQAIWPSQVPSSGMPAACATCHVILPPEWFDRLPEAVEDEEDMLDLATGACRTSRLSCQIVLTDALDGIEVRIPDESRDMQMR